MPELISLQPNIAQSVCSVLISNAELFASVEKVKYDLFRFFKIPFSCQWDWVRGVTWQRFPEPRSP